MSAVPAPRPSRRRLLRWAAGSGLAAFAGAFGSRLRLARSHPGRLRFAHTYTTESERAVLGQVTAEFESAHPGLRIEHSALNSEVYNSVGWRLQFQGRHQPDLYFHWQGFKVDQCIRRGWAMDLGPRLSPGFRRQFVPAALREQRGGLYFLPQSIDLCNLVWYNRDLFDRLGLSEPRTFGEWLEICRRVRSAGWLPLAQGNRDLWPMGNFAAELAGQSVGPDAFGRFFEPGTGLPADVPRALVRLAELRDAGAFDLDGVLSPGAIGEMSDIDAKVLFLGGRSAMHLLGSWFLADILDARAKGGLKFEVGLFSVPPAEGETDALAGVTTGFLMHPRGANLPAGVEFLELFLSRKYQAEFARMGALSGRSDAAEFTLDPLARRMLGILGAGTPVVPPPDTGFPPDQANVFYEVVARLLTRRLEPATAPAYWAEEKRQLARKGL